MSFFLAGYEGASIEHLSSYYVKTLYHMLLGGMSTSSESDEPLSYACIKGGSCLLTEKLSQKLDHDQRVHTDMSLVAVEKNENKQYLLTFKNGQKVEADILVLAMPCSVYSDIRFGEGIIPDAQLEAIKNVGYGTNAKIIVPLDLTAVENIEGGRARFQLFTDSVATFFSVHQDALGFYYVNESSFFTSDTIKNRYQQDSAFVAPVFKNADFAHFVSTYARDEQFAQYEGAAVGHSWPNDPFAKGSYSYIAAGQEKIMTSMHEELGETVKTLFRPVDQKLYFAGEHATILPDVLGTMEGACESGERTARMIENAIKKSEDNVE
jgi:monoamine oxidase